MLESVQRRHWRSELPFSNAAALPASRTASSGVSIAQASADQLGQVAGRPAPAARAPAGELVLVLEDLAESADFDAFHCRSMIAGQGQALSLQI